MTDRPDAVMAEITAAVELSQGGHAAAARERFDAIGDGIGPDTDPFHLCVLAHHAADVRTDPSLHLNLADVHRRRGDRDRAREHLDRARETVGRRDDDGYGRMIRDGIARCAARLTEESRC